MREGMTSYTYLAFLRLLFLSHLCPQFCLLHFVPNFIIFVYSCINLFRSIHFLPRSFRRLHILSYNNLVYRRPAVRGRKCRGCIICVIIISSAKGGRTRKGKGGSCRSLGLVEGNGELHHER